MTAYYNEIDPFAAQWLRNLIAAGHIAPGDVDERSITEVQPDDLRGYRQCHFFAGIGLWSLALRWAGWPDDREAWTGSCPCQPLSSAGQRKGHADERHLWPAFHGLIAERGPAVVFGEQVASKDGREWFSAVRADLEGSGYACGAADLCAAGAGAPHIRQRLFWVADADFARPQGRVERGNGSGECAAGPDRMGGRLADAERDECGQERQNGSGRGEGSGAQGLDQRSGDGGAVCRLADAQCNGQHRSGETGPGRRGKPANGSGGDSRPRPPHGFWADADWLFCRDGKWRPAQPGIFPLVDGYPARVGVLRAYGNAICPEVAAEFIAAYQDIAFGQAPKPGMGLVTPHAIESSHASRFLPTRRGSGPGFFRGAAE